MTISDGVKEILLDSVALDDPTAMPDFETAVLIWVGMKPLSYPWQLDTCVTSYAKNILFSAGSHH